MRHSGLGGCSSLSVDSIHAEIDSGKTTSLPQSSSTTRTPTVEPEAARSLFPLPAKPIVDWPVVADLENDHTMPGVSVCTSWIR